MPNSDADDRVLSLLLKAIDSLAPEERTEVLMFLLKRGLTGSQPEAQGFLSLGSSVRVQGLLRQGVTLSPTDPPARPERGAGVTQQVVPVRFSADAHQRLRTWCGEKGFPMAAVVRGLVDEFLDKQRPGTA